MRLLRRETTTVTLANIGRNGYTFQCVACVHSRTQNKCEAHAIYKTQRRRHSRGYYSVKRGTNIRGKSSEMQVRFTEPKYGGAHYLVIPNVQLTVYVLGNFPLTAYTFGKISTEKLARKRLIGFYSVWLA